MRARRGLIAGLTVVVVLMLAGLSAWRGPRYLHGAALVVRVAGLGGWPERIAAWPVVPIDEQGAVIPWRGGQLRARLFQPRRRSGRAILLAPGVHAAGADEPRLVSFARRLAELGHPVAAVELPDLQRYQITGRTTDMIEDAGRWLAEQRALAPDGKVGLLGISFGGGLTVVAAGRPALRERAAWVMSLGGHGDLTRVLRYLCTGELPDGRTRAPHDYGVVVILLAVAERLVPHDQVPPLRQALRAYLGASHVDMIDRPRARALFQAVERTQAALPRPSADWLRLVIDRDVGRLGPRLLGQVAAMGGDPALSPATAPAPSAPVFLLHGAEDNVIPAAESAALAARLRAAGTPVHLLATPLITHAEVDGSADLLDRWRLVGFWADLLAD